MKDCYDKKYLRKLLLNYKIRTEIKTRMGRVILLAIPFSETMIDNIYLLSDDENIIWRVETNKTVPDKVFLVILSNRGNFCRQWSGCPQFSLVSLVGSPSNGPFTP